MPFKDERTWDFQLGHHRLPALFNADECRDIIGYHENRDHFPASSTAGGESYRSTDVFWLNYSEDRHHWIYDRIAQASHEFNDAHYRFEIEECTNLQLARYKPGQHYDWHADLGAEGYSRRKLSLAIMLSSLDEFSGSRLQFGTGKFIQDAEMEQGDAIVFPAWQPHRVTPVTDGERWTLVGWWLGPPFR